MLPIINSGSFLELKILTNLNYQTMKNFTFCLLFVFVTAIGSSQACPDPTSVVCDDLDGYALGDVLGQTGADHWAPWPGGSLSAQVTGDQFFSGTQSLSISAGPVLDMLFLTGDQTDGLTTLTWKMYIPTGATAYFNVQADPTAGEAYIYQIYFNENGASPGLGAFQQLPPTFEYPEDTWFDVSISVNMNTMTHSLALNGEDILVNTAYVANAGGGVATTFSSINFYAVDAANQYYLDDIVLHYDPATSIEQIDEQVFTVYPNPTNDVLYVASELAIENMVLRDLIGKEVLSLNRIDQNQSQLSLAALSNGVYTLTVQIDGQVFTQKIVKK